MKVVTVVVALGLCFCAVQASAATADDGCIIDTVMKENRVSMDKMVAGIYKANVTDQMAKAVDAAPSVKDASCLPMLDTLDSLIRMRIPSIGGALGGLMTKIRDMACNMANSYLEQVAAKAQFNYSDPLGIASVGIGATNGVGGTQTSTYDLSKVVEDTATKIAKDKLRQGTNETNSVINSLPAGPSNRVPRAETTIPNVMMDSVNGL
ncbi:MULTISPECIES: hypothetical protein [Pseudomonas syringae group]|uniref:hypothetical protein n=1 Tax=Pseudomonas syringae group TaxID=136849 RepID=UPI0011C3A3EF|nr:MULTISPECIES: hypothetical protein [Pseudomonas syringae group]MDH4602449.1 hypothetical protein [Pseudomonas syringae pv. papulans]